MLKLVVITLSDTVTVVYVELYVADTIEVIYKPSIPQFNCTLRKAINSDVSSPKTLNDDALTYSASIYNSLLVHQHLKSTEDIFSS